MEDADEAIAQQNLDFASFCTTGTAVHTVARLIDPDQREAQTVFGWPAEVRRCAPRWDFVLLAAALRALCAATN